MLDGIAARIGRHDPAAQRVTPRGGVGESLRLSSAVSVRRRPQAVGLVVVVTTDDWHPASRLSWPPRPYSASAQTVWLFDAAPRIALVAFNRVRSGTFGARWGLSVPRAGGRSPAWSGARTIVTPMPVEHRPADGNPSPLAPGRSRRRGAMRPLPTQRRHHQVASKAAEHAQLHPERGCWCRELGHVMRPADTRVSGRRGGLVVAAERSLQAAGEWALQAPAVAAIGADGGCCSARRTHAAPPRGGAVR